MRVPPHAIKMQFPGWRNCFRTSEIISEIRTENKRRTDKLLYFFFPPRQTDDGWSVIFLMRVQCGVTSPMHTLTDSLKKKNTDEANLTYLHSWSNSVISAVMMDFVRRCQHSPRLHLISWSSPHSRLDVPAHKHNSIKFIQTARDEKIKSIFLLKVETHANSPLNNSAAM